MLERKLRKNKQSASRPDPEEKHVPPIKPGFDPEPIIKIIRQARTKNVIKLEEILYQHGYNVPTLIIESFVEQMEKFC